LQLRELIRECGKLFAELRQLLVLQNLVFDHLPQLLNILGDILSVDDRDALSEGRSSRSELKTRC
jgi:hypothetical protein